MDTNQYYSSSREVARLEETTACHCPTTLQWTTPNCKGAEYQTAWSFSPLSFSTNSQPCLCHRYRSIECCSKLKISFDRDNSDKPESSKPQDKCLTTSKSLKFGIERILTKNSVSDNSTDNLNNRSIKSSDKPTSGRCRRKNGTRSVFSHVQRNILELHYQQREYVTKGERYHIAMATGITEEQVKIWFQNRRTKKKKLEKSKMTTSENKSENHSLSILNFSSKNL